MALEPETFRADTPADTHELDRWHLKFQSGSLTVSVTTAMGTGVVTGARIFALTGQVAEYAGLLLPLAFVDAAG